jgi:lipopolysaccharide/colanic/teichoic acid biosynthesis glycosyltransferase
VTARLVRAWILKGRRPGLNEVREQVLAPLTGASVDGAAQLDAAISRLDAAVATGARRIPSRERIFDLTLTIVLAPVIAIVGALIAIAIYADSPGPVIFRSQRIGRGGKPFEMLKFRKMRRDAPTHPVTLDDDERFTPIGRFLAASRLDELPQMINVLRGEMRLVGPRPELEHFIAQYPEQYAEILRITPGITGNSQLQFADERRLLEGPDPENVYSAVVLPAKIEIDIDYTRSHSLSGDLAILTRTALLPFSVLGRRARESDSLRRWGPMVGAAILLGALFVLFSSRLA